MTDTRSDTPIVFLDTETTELNPRLRRPWDIAMIRRPALVGASSDRLTILVEDVDLADANKDSLDIGRFYERHPSYNGRNVIDEPWAGAPPGCFGLPGIPLGPNEMLMSEREAAIVVERWTRGTQIIGLVPDFDSNTLDPALRRHGLLPGWHYQVLDVESEAAGWLKGRLYAGDPELLARAEEIRAALTLPRKSEAVSLLCGVALPSEAARHTAMGDTLWVERWWDALGTVPPAAGTMP